MENKLKTIENLEKEMKRIREEIESKKKEVETAGKEPISSEKQKEITSEAVREHIEKYPPEKLEEKYKITEQEKKIHIEKLEPEPDDRKIEELLQFAKEKGIINAFEICKQLSPHLADDFHRKLVHYLNFELNDGADKNIAPAKFSGVNLILIAAAILIAFFILILIFK